MLPTAWQPSAPAPFLKPRPSGSETPLCAFYLLTHGSPISLPCRTAVPAWHLPLGERGFLSPRVARRYPVGPPTLSLLSSPPHITRLQLRNPPGSEPHALSY